MRESGNNQAYESFRSAVDLAMGTLYVVVSVYCMKMPLLRENYDEGTVYGLGILFSLYGIFRLFRGGQRLKKAFQPGPRRKRS
jgi:hypothetical protein